jgi:hypothetical protein
MSWKKFLNPPHLAISNPNPIKAIRKQLTSNTLIDSSIFPPFFYLIFNNFLSDSIIPYFYIKSQYGKEKAPILLISSEYRGFIT